MKTKQLNQWIKQMLSLLKTKSVLVKMMSGYICIFLIVVMFNSCIYFYLKPIFIQKEVTNATNYLSYISERVDMNLLKVKDSMHKFLDNSEIIKGKRGKGIDDINSQLLMTSDLIYFMDSNPIVKYAAVYNPKNNIAIASDGTLSTATLIDKIAHESGLSQQDVLSGIENGKNFGTFPAAEMNSNDEKTTGYFTFYTGVSYSNNDYKMISFVSKEEIEKLLKKDNISEYSKTYILNRNYDTWLSTDGDVIDKDLIENDSKYDGNTAVTTKSAFQDWVYVSILNDKMIVKNLGFIKNTFLILILAMMGLCIFISIKFVKSYYNPIANIIDRYLLTINGGTNEFDAISNTLENLKSENENSAEKEVLTGILKSGFYSDELEKMFEYNFFRIIVMRAISDESINFEIINQVGLGNDFVFKVIQETHNGCSIILNGDELSYNKTMALILGLQQEYFKETSVFAAFGISNICDELMDIHEAYKEAIMAIDHGDSSCESCIYMYRDINNINQNMYLPIDFERRMTEAVYTRNTEEISNIIQDIFKRNYGVPNVYMHSVIITISSVYTTLRQKIGNGEQISENIINHELRIDVLKDYFKKLYTTLEGDLIKENRVDAVRNYVVMYIKENYSDPTVSIETIAEEMSLSASYVSTLFKKATGIAFSQYISQYRIDVAQDLLRNTNEKVSVVSEKAGFGTYNNFVRMFKKRIGVSPSQYRDDIRTENRKNGKNGKYGDEDNRKME